MSLFYINLDKDFTERFDMGKLFEFTDNYDPLTSNFSTELLAISQNGSYVITGEDTRPDLISFRIFGKTQYWWILMMYNNVLDHRSLLTGDVLKVPNIDDLENLYFSLKSKQNAVA